MTLVVKADPLVNGVQTKIKKYVMYTKVVYTVPNIHV